VGMARGLRVHLHRRAKSAQRMPAAPR